MYIPVRYVWDRSTPKLRARDARGLTHRLYTVVCGCFFRYTSHVRCTVDGAHADKIICSHYSTVKIGKNQELIATEMIPLAYNLE